MFWLELAAVAVGSLSLVALPYVRVLRAVPRGKRLRMLGRLILIRRSIAKRRAGALLEPEVAASDFAPAPSARVAFGDLAGDPALVVDRRVVSPRIEAGRGVALDVDGSVVLVGPAADQKAFGHSKNPGYVLTVVAPGGGRITIAEGGSHDTGIAYGVSIDRGDVTWWRTDESARAELWLAEAGKPPRILGVRTPTETIRDVAAFGWTGVADGRVVWTLGASTRADLGVTRYDGTTVIVTSNAAVTLHRDLEAERDNRVAFAWAFVDIPIATGSLVATLDLGETPPKVVPHRRGLFLGATAVDGDPCGFRMADRTLELPGGLWVSLGTDVMAGDFAATKEWVAVSRVERTPGGMRFLPTVFHVPTRRATTLANSGGAMVYMRGEHLLWNVCPEPRRGAGRNEYEAEVCVGRLSRPTTITPPDVPEAPGASGTPVTSATSDVDARDLE
jgi:hypothetical protein